MTTAVTPPRAGLDRSVLIALAGVVQRRVLLTMTAMAALYAGALTLALRLDEPVVTVAATLALTMVMSGFIQAAHDCVHGSHLRSRRANRVMGAAWCTPILINFTNYRYQHLVHHRFTGVPGDTEPEKTFTGLGAYLYSMSGITLWRYNVITATRTWQHRFPASVTGHPDRRRASRQDNLVICLWVAVALTLTAIFPYAVLLGYWLPLLASTVVARFTGLTEHYGLWGVPDIERNTRTVRSNPVMRFFMWNANYHAEHHRFPAVPTLNLHRLHRALPEPHPLQAASYTAFHLRLIRHLTPGETS
ncbi:Omega-3 fatty acid desaturase [Actinoplanes sp. SE50]|uniref:fatty acid desaturase family protein n=1 Tax=unclassified Actinoplanes TaxID=2626549 RepID=UPI00023EBE50|nr:MULTISPECIES: fatty acid desaturase [unclassified Actinoplanes]AEV81264.1 Omega-3 fatty acid desaturase [Actinoplanes sp. SE50/110]ATO79667.1 Omega-3 fatty acid desaturase [Actinoplanes sp. SE50]SLL97070.1 Omega-3 fatty acid desaturase [Actinoplanes sp. SE50/110]